MKPKYIRHYDRWECRISIYACIAETKVLALNEVLSWMKRDGKLFSTKSPDASANGGKNLSA